MLCDVNVIPLSLLHVTCDVFRCCFSSILGTKLAVAFSLSIVIVSILGSRLSDVQDNVLQLNTSHDEGYELLTHV